ncbi:MAG: alpha/beta hydrolase [Tabrizicola sp.]|nr:alpha/beta hydrolase [Tabrizicola sp.]
MSEEAPFFADLAEGPAGGRAVWLHASDGVRIRAGIWAEGSKGTVVLLPGRTECIEKYGRAARSLGQRGYAVIAVDWRGQGIADHALPDRMSGHVGHFEEYQRDLDALLAEADRAGLPGPRYLIGHSMGGCIALRALVRGIGFRAAVFSAPMWGIAMAPWQRPLALTVSRILMAMGQGRRYVPGTGATTYVLDAAFEGNVLTKDREMWDYMRAQLLAQPDLALGGPSLVWLHAALAECRNLARLPSPDVPAICAIGTAERVIDTAPAHLRMAGWAKGQLDLYPGAEHEIMMEGPAVRTRFFDRAVSLFEANG